MRPYDPVSPRAPFIWHGGDYNPEQWPPATWDDDVTLMVEGANAVTLRLTSATSYGGGPEALALRQLAAAPGQSYVELRGRHLADHAALFDRADLDRGEAPAAQLPTDQLRGRASREGAAPQLVALLFQYGHYLLIASSRAGAQPANLAAYATGFASQSTLIAAFRDFVGESPSQHRRRAARPEPSTTEQPDAHGSR